MEPNKQPDKYEEKLGIGNYIGKQIYEIVVGFGGIIGGAVGGFFAGKALFPKAEPLGHVKVGGLKTEAMAKLENAENAAKWKVNNPFSNWPGLKEIPAKVHGYTALGGMFVGSIVATLLLGYGHWKKEKQAQMQVDEITRDVSNIEIFKKTDPELAAENKRLWAELKKRDEQPVTHAERVRPTHKPEHASHAEHVRDSQTAAEHAEGASLA